MPTQSLKFPSLPSPSPSRKSLLFALRREINEPLLGLSLLPHLCIVAWLSFQEVRRFYEQHLLPEVKGAGPPLHEWDTQNRNCSTKEMQPLLLYSPGPWREQAESPCGNCRWIWHVPDPSSPNRPAEEQGHLHLRLQSQIPTARLSLWLGKPPPFTPLISQSSLSSPSPPFLFLFLFPPSSFSSFSSLSSSFLPSSSPTPQVVASQVGGLVLAYGSRAGIRGGRVLAAPESRVGFRVFNHRDSRKESAIYLDCVW